MRTVFIVAVDSITSKSFDWFASSVNAYQFFSKTKRQTDLATRDEIATFHKVQVPSHLIDSEVTDYIGNNGLDEPECGKCASYPFYLEDWHAKLEAI